MKDYSLRINKGFLYSLRGLVTINELKTPILLPPPFLKIGKNEHKNQGMIISMNAGYSVLYYIIVNAGNALSKAVII